MRPLYEQLALERQKALIAEGARLSRAASLSGSEPARTRSRRAVARNLHALAVRIDALEIARIHSA